MLNFRLESYEQFLQKPMPTWGADLSSIDFDNIHYYIRPQDRQARSWDDVPDDIKSTFDKLGIPEAERKFLAGVGAQYDSEVVYHSIQKDLEDQGVVFLDMDSGLREHPDLVREYFGTIIPNGDNKFAALNSAVWSGGSFVYVPEGVKVEIPLQAYFRINSENMGQFERTLIIMEPGRVRALRRRLHGAGLRQRLAAFRGGGDRVKEGARCRYTTIQNWSTDVSIWSPSARSPTETRRWNGWTGISAAR